MGCTWPVLVLMKNCRLWKPKHMNWICFVLDKVFKRAKDPQNGHVAYRQQKQTTLLNSVIFTSSLDQFLSWPEKSLSILVTLIATTLHWPVVRAPDWACPGLGPHTCYSTYTRVCTRENNNWVVGTRSKSNNSLNHDPTAKVINCFFVL